MFRNFNHTVQYSDIDDCLPDPCEHNGTCNDEINDYTCTCVPGYTDKNCSTGKQYV